MTEVNPHKVFSEKDFPAYLPKLNQLYDDLFSGGKGFRSKLIERVSKHLQLKKDQIALLAQTIEFIHNASLLHDDLVDRSQLRRGKTAAWHKYSPEYAVLAGDYLLARVMVNLSRYGNLFLIQYTAEMISDLLEGEWIQDSLVHDWDIQLDQLDQVHQLKTASLFKWCLRSPFICGEIEKPEIHQLLEEMGAILGVLFQRGDDLLDFDIRNFEGKAVLGDLKSGYLNSFGVFLSRDFEPAQKKQMMSCESIEDLKNQIGHGAFNKKVSDFDEMNQQIIDLYHHHNQELIRHLSEQQKGLGSDLQSLPSILYWRRA